MIESTSPTPRQFTVFGVIAEAWHLTKGAKWAILAPVLAGLLPIIFSIALYLGFLYVQHFLGNNIIGLIVNFMILALIARVMYVKIRQTTLGSSKNFYLVEFALAIIFGILVFFFSLFPAILCFIGLLLTLATLYIISGLLAGIINTSIERARGHEISNKTGFKSFSRSAPVALTFLVNAIILSPPQLISFYFFGFHNANIGMMLIALVYSVEIGSLLYLCLPLAVEKTNSPFTATLSSLKASKDYWFKLMGIFVILYVTPYVVFLLSMLAFFISALLVSYLPGISLHAFMLYQSIISIAFTILLFIPFIWLVPLMFLIQGVVYHKLVDERSE